MSYGEVDQFDVERNTRYMLPGDIRYLILSSKEVEMRLERGESPVDLSTIKWERLCEVIQLIQAKTSPGKYIHNLKGKIGYQSCALCLASIEQYHRQHGKMDYKEDKCKVCPLARIDRCVDPDSAYRKVETIVEEFVEGKVEDHQVKSKIAELLVAAQQMVLNIKALKRAMLKKNVRKGSNADVYLGRDGH